MSEAPPVAREPGSGRGWLAPFAVVLGALVLGGIGVGIWARWPELQTRMLVGRLGGEEAEAELAAMELAAQGERAWGPLREAVLGAPPARGRALALLESAGDASALDGLPPSVLLEIRCAVVEGREPGPLRLRAASELGFAKDARAGAALAAGLGASDPELVDVCATGLRQRGRRGLPVPADVPARLRAALERGGSSNVVLALAALGDSAEDVAALAVLVDDDLGDPFERVNLMHAYAELVARVHAAGSAERAAAREKLTELAASGTDEVVAEAARAAAETLGR